MHLMFIGQYRTSVWILEIWFVFVKFTFSFNRNFRNMAYISNWISVSYKDRWIAWKCLIKIMKFGPNSKGKTFLGWNNTKPIRRFTGREKNHGSRWNSQSLVLWSTEKRWVGSNMFTKKLSIFTEIYITWKDSGYTIKNHIQYKTSAGNCGKIRTPANQMRNGLIESVLLYWM